MKERKVYVGCAGLGGNRKHWQDVDVTAVEYTEKIANAYKLNHPSDNVIVDDAFNYFQEHFERYDFAWFSPSCQKHSRMVKFTRHKVRVIPPVTEIYGIIIFLKTWFNEKKWVVENVQPYYEPLIEPTAILGRHLFWSNFPIEQFYVQSPPDFINMGNTAGAEQLKEWLGIHYPGNIYYDGNHSPTQVLRNCVHPDLGLHVFNEMLKSEGRALGENTTRSQGPEATPDLFTSKAS